MFFIICLGLATNWFGHYLLDLHELCSTNTIFYMYVYLFQNKKILVNKKSEVGVISWVNGKKWETVCYKAVYIVELKRNII